MYITSQEHSICSRQHTHMHYACKGYIKTFPFCVPTASSCCTGSYSKQVGRWGNPWWNVCWCVCVFVKCPCEFVFVCVPMHLRALSTLSDQPWNHRQHSLSTCTHYVYTSHLTSSDLAVLGPAWLNPYTKQLMGLLRCRCLYSQSL